MKLSVRFFKRKIDDFNEVLSALKNLIVFVLTPTRIKRLSYDNKILSMKMTAAKIEMARVIRETDNCIIRNENIPWRLRNQLESLREFRKLLQEKS